MGFPATDVFTSQKGTFTPFANSDCRIENLPYPTTGSARTIAGTILRSVNALAGTVVGVAVDITNGITGPPPNNNAPLTYGTLLLIPSIVLTFLKVGLTIIQIPIMVQGGNPGSEPGILYGCVNPNNTVFANFTGFPGGQGSLCFQAIDSDQSISGQNFSPTPKLFSFIYQDYPAGDLQGNPNSFLRPCIDFSFDFDTIQLAVNYLIAAPIAGPGIAPLGVGLGALGI